MRRRIDPHRVVVRLGAERAHDPALPGNVERVPLVTKLQLSQRPQASPDGAFVGGRAPLVPHRPGQLHRVRQPLQVRPRRGRVGRPELRPAWIVEAPAQVARQPVPLLHGQQPVADLERKVRELPASRLFEHGRAGLRMPRHERRVPFPVVPSSAAREGRCPPFHRGRPCHATPYRLRPEQHRLAGIEVPVLTVAFGRKEEGAETPLLVHKGLYAGRQHFQLPRELFGPRGLQDREAGQRRRAQLGPRALDNRTPSVPHGSKVPRQVGAQVSQGRLADDRVAPQPRPSREGQSRQKAPDGVVRSGIHAAARPVLVRQRPVGRLVAKHPSRDARGQVARAVLPLSLRRGHERPAAKQLRHLGAALASQQELPGGKDTQAAACDEVGGAGFPPCEELLQRPREREVRGEHAGRSEANDLAPVLDLHADDPRARLQNTRPTRSGATRR